MSEIGRKAGVVVNKADGRFAGAHDLRRSFGTRWAPRVKPITLMRLMRHESVQTTMKFCVELDADDEAEELWKAYGQEGPVLGPPHLQRQKAAVPQVGQATAQNPLLQPLTAHCEKIDRA